MKKITAVLITLTLAIVTVFAVGCTNKPQTTTNNNEYTVTFDYNYEGAPAVVTQKVKHGQTVTAPANPVRSGYTFAGWYNGAARFELTSAVESDLTLWARWNNAPAVVENNLIFEVADGVKYLFEHGDTPTGVKIGDTVKFSVEQSPFYKGTAKVYANETLLTATKEAGDVHEIYTVTVEEPTTVTVTDIEPDTGFFGGLGTESNPYKISSPAQWVLFANIMNRQLGNINSRHFELTHDLDFLGYSIPSTVYFGGTLNGNGHKLKNFEISVNANIPHPEDPDTINDSANAGLFGRLAAADIHDLELNGKVTVAGNTIMCAGLLAGDIVSSTVKNVHVSGEVSYVNTNAYYTSIGGFAATIRSIEAFGPTSVTYCSSSVTVNANYLAYAGGFVARMSGNKSAASHIANSTSTGNVTGGHYSGGFAAYLGAYSSVANSYCTGSVIAEISYESGTCSAGAFVGYMSVSETVIQNCFSSSDYAAYAADPKNAHAGNIYGEYDLDFSTVGADLNDSLIYEYYYAPGGVYGTYDLKTEAGVSGLLGWNTDKWTFDGENLPTVTADVTKQVTSPLTVTIDLDGKTITQTDTLATPDEYGNYPTITATDSLEFTVSEYTAISGLSEPHKVELGNGMLIRASGTTFFSCGYCYEKGGNQVALPAAFLITDNDSAKVPSVNLKFTDYKEVIGEYDFVLSGTKYTLTLVTPTASELSSGRESYEVTYVYYGNGKIVMTGLPAFIGVDEIGATVSGDTIEFAGIEATLRGDNYLADFTGTYVTDIYSDSAILFTDIDDEYIFTDGGAYSLVLSKYGELFIGAYYYVDVDVILAVIFDGEDDFDDYLFQFDEDGYLQQCTYSISGNSISVTGIEQIYSFAGAYADGNFVIENGAFAGEWRDEVSDFGITLNGLTCYGYGHATDNDGVEYTYKVVDNGVIAFLYDDGTYAFGALFMGTDLYVVRNDKVLRTVLYNKFGGYWYSGENTLVIDNAGVKVNGDLSVDYEYEDPYAIIFVYDNVVYSAAITADNELTLTQIYSDADDVVYKRHDEFYGKFIDEDRTISFEFNGMADFDGGKVIITENGKVTEYDYKITAHGTPTISSAAEIDNFGTVSFNNGLLRVVPFEGRNYYLGVENEFTGTWSVQQNPLLRLKVGLLGYKTFIDDETGKSYKKLAGEGYFQVFEEAMPNIPNVDLEYDSGALMIRDKDSGFYVPIDSRYGLYALAILPNDGMNLFISDGENGDLLLMERCDEAWGIWTSSEGGRLEIDGTAFNSDIYRGVMRCYDKYNVAGSRYDYFLYDKELLNDEYVYCIYNVADGFLDVYATFEILTAATTAEIKALREELDGSGTAYEMYSKLGAQNTYLIIKPLGAVLGNVNVNDKNGKRLGTFGESFSSAIAAGTYEGGTVELHVDIKIDTYRYSVEYLSEDGTYILSLYEQGHNGNRGKLVYFAIVTNVDGELVMELIENTDTASLPQNLFAAAA